MRTFISLFRYSSVVALSFSITIFAFFFDTLFCHQVLQEYCKVMKPLINCLDRLQAEENAYLGVLLPTLTLMRVALERMEEARGDQALTYAKPLVRALLRQEGNKGGFNNRYKQPNL